MLKMKDLRDDKNDYLNRRMWRALVKGLDFTFNYKPKSWWDTHAMVTVDEINEMTLKDVLEVYDGLDKLGKLHFKGFSYRSYEMLKELANK